MRCGRYLIVVLLILLDANSLSMRDEILKQSEDADQDASSPSARPSIGYSLTFRYYGAPITGDGGRFGGSRLRCNLLRAPGRDFPTHSVDCFCHRRPRFAADRNRRKSDAGSNQPLRNIIDLFDNLADHLHSF